MFVTLWIVIFLAVGKKMKRETNVGRCRMKDVKDSMIYGDTMTLADFALGQQLKARDRDFL